jgi:hypothetical protein
MFQQVKILISGLLVLSSSCAARKDSSLSSATLEQSRHEIFAEHYYSEYQQRFCAENTIGFLKAVKAAEGSVDKFVKVTIRNNGGSMFGMLNVEASRGIAFNQPAVKEANWYFHVFAVDQDGYVFDFDFMITSQKIKFAEYADRMYLDEPGCQTGRNTDAFCVGRDRKLDGYHLEFVKGEDVIDGNNTITWKGTLKEALAKLAPQTPGN